MQVRPAQEVDRTADDEAAPCGIAGFADEVGPRSLTARTEEAGSLARGTLGPRREVTTRVLVLPSVISTARQAQPAAVELGSPP